MPPLPTPAAPRHHLPTEGRPEPAPAPASGPASVLGKQPPVPGPARQTGRAAQAGWVLLVALGLLVPWWFNLRYFAGGGSVLPQVFFRDAMANALTTAITWDVYLAAVAFSAWVLGERRARRPWLYVAACFGVGLSFALPLYLLLRRRGD